MENTTTEHNRKLARLAKIESIKPIFLWQSDKQADSIEMVKVHGWHVITGKGEFKPDDHVIYFEVDSVLPQNEKWVLDYCEPLRKTDYRVKTFKLNKMYYFNDSMEKVNCISQGFVIPENHNILPQLYPVGYDLTEFLGVVKYEIPEFGQGNNKLGIIHKKSTFPEFVPKTNEERLQNYPELLDELHNQPYYITQKLDGSSCTMWYDEGEVHVASRNQELKMDSSNIWTRIAQQEIYKVFFETNPELVLQGEIVGHNIQKNKLDLTGIHFYVFNIYDRIMECFYSWNAMMHLCIPLNINLVPLIETGQQFNYTQDQLIKLSQNTTEQFPNYNPSEGIVVRCYDNRQISPTLHGKPLSFKVINPEFEAKQK